MSTPHNQAQVGEIAQTVLMPGDPLRAKFLAETYLEDVHQFNAVRNMLGYTGTYKGKKVSIMGSGMGQPSIGIYSHELFSQYGVEAIIRIGSCGALVENVHLRDVIIAQGACTDSNFAHQFELPGTYSAISSYDLLEKSCDSCKREKCELHVGNIIASDIFYHFDQRNNTKVGFNGMFRSWNGILCPFATAARLGKKALTLLTVSDSFVTDEQTTPEEREKTFTAMMEIALEIA